MRLAPPAPEQLERTAPFLRLLSEAARHLHGTLEMDTEYGFIGRYTSAQGLSRPIFGKALGLNSDSAAALAADKDYTARWLAADALPTPTGVLVFSPAYRDGMALKNAEVAHRLPGTDAALAFAETVGFPVIVKPNSGAEGRGIRLAHSASELRRDLKHGFVTDDRLRVERCVPGRDYRLLVLGGRVVLAYERQPFSITGDGCRTIGDLLTEALTRLASQHRGKKIAPDDPRIQRRLARLTLAPDSILPNGDQLALLANANLSTGGQVLDLTGKLPAACEQLAIAATNSLGLTLAGVDILAPDLATGPDGATILELNASPGLDYYASESPDHWARAQKVVTAMLAHLD